MSSETETNPLDITSVDPQLMSDLSEYRIGAIDYFVAIYSHHFDKRFKEVTHSLAEDEDKRKKFADMRANHLRQCEQYIEKRLDLELKQLFDDQSVVQKVKYISDNRVDVEFPDLQRAIQPVKQECVERLVKFEAMVTEVLDNKHKQLADVTEEVTQALHQYESNRRSLQKVCHEF